MACQFDDQVRDALERLGYSGILCMRVAARALLQDRHATKVPARVPFWERKGREDIIVLQLCSRAHVGPFL